jgi:hypothetical protein
LAADHVPRPDVGIVHVHSDYSHDGRDSVEALRAFALHRRLRFVGITDHAEDFDGAKFDRLRRECERLSDERVLLIPGLEFRFEGFKGVHLLALGLTRWIRPRTFEEFFAESEGAVGLTIAAHPVLYRWTLPEAVADRIDAIEVWNAAYNTRYLPDPRAMDLLGRVRSRRSDVVGIAGLDQHDGRNDRGTRITLTSREWTDPLVEMRAGRFENSGLHLRFDSHATLSRPRRVALVSGRAVLDFVNLAHERMVRTVRAVRS